jgi:hypothetical protein
LRGALFCAVWHLLALWTTVSTPRSSAPSLLLNSYLAYSCLSLR